MPHPLLNVRLDVGTLARLAVSYLFKMSYFRKTVFWLGAIYLVPFVFGEANHYRRYGHLAPLGLHADVVVRSGDIGVKGVSKL